MWEDDGKDEGKDEGKEERKEKGYGSPGGWRDGGLRLR